MTPPVCKECGCKCDNCSSSTSSYLDLHQQIAELHSQLQRSSSHIHSIEHELMDSKQAMDVELVKTKEELSRLRERYDRLLESHKKMQKINHDLEDKLLTMVNQFESEKVSLQQELSSIMNKLVDARTLINQLDEESDKYRMDCNMAVQLLQCKPSNFVAHKLNTLPVDLQERVRQHMTREQLIAAEKGSFPSNDEQKLIRVPIATFPPTAMVFSLNQNVNKPQQNDLHNNESDINRGFVPMSLIARVLSQKEKRHSYPRMYLCMSCKRDVFHNDSGCQVDLLPRTSRTVEITTRHGGHRHSLDLVHSSSGIKTDEEVNGRERIDSYKSRSSRERLYSDGSETDL